MLSRLLIIFGSKRQFTATCSLIHHLFGIEKVPYEDKRQKIFAAQTPPRKRGYGRILPTETKYASEIPKTLVLHCPRNCVAKSPRDKRADMGFCTKLNIFGTSVIFNILKQSTGLIFLPSSLTRDDFYTCYFYV